MTSTQLCGGLPHSHRVHSGAASCRALHTDLSKGSLHALGRWLLGFLTGIAETYNSHKVQCCPSLVNKGRQQITQGSGLLCLVTSTAKSSHISATQNYSVLS
jgi:hypothetical protein